MSRLGKELVFSRENVPSRRWTARDATFRGDALQRQLRQPPSGRTGDPVFWKEPDEPVRTPPGSGGPPAVIQVFTLVHEVPLIFRSDGDSRDRKNRESPLALLSLQCCRGCAVKETEREKFV